MERGEHEAVRGGKSNRSLRRTKSSKEAKMKRRWRMAFQNIRASASLFFVTMQREEAVWPPAQWHAIILPKSEGKCSASIWGEDCSAPHSQRFMLLLKQIWENSHKKPYFSLMHQSLYNTVLEISAVKGDESVPRNSCLRPVPFLKTAEEFFKSTKLSMWSWEVQYRTVHCLVQVYPLSQHRQV